MSKEKNGPPEPFRWKPGQSGNPAGRPKITWRRAYQEEGDKIYERDCVRPKRTQRQVLAARHYRQALEKGSLRAAEIIQDREEGKAVQPTIDAGAPITPEQLAAKIEDFLSRHRGPEKPAADDRKSVDTSIN